ncbi:MAG: hypothetical protein ABW321_18165 [Polyangiales bacterium]
MRSRIGRLGLVWAVACSAGLAHAQVIEPNGLMVPVPPTTANESSLQSFFDTRMPPEPIDAVAEASAEPSTFSPRCGFQAELVLSQSSAPAGLAWYNVPADPTAAPDAVYLIVPETTQPGAMISSNQIRSDPSYAGGSIGFALTKFGGKPIYYSEAQRNVACTACVMPGHWKLMLAYPSPLMATTYYLAWEDWEGANESTWPDDGDFNDKVFRLSGVRCAGGGEPCETGLPGACAQGLTGCSTGAAPAECSPLEAATDEVCDGIDNDCDARVDENHPCASGDACVQGRCTRACGGVEFGCEDGMSCIDGQCVAAACAGVTCEVGTICENGSCRAPCEDVQCPLGQVCRSGLCKDPCAGVSCNAGSVCREGACLESCACSGCPSGQVCDADSGRCAEAGCEGKTCPAGQACAQGQCVDACRDARCPHGAACSGGACENTAPVAPQAGGSAPLINQAGTGQPTAAQANPVAANSGASGSDEGVSGRLRSHDPGCGCRTVTSSPHPGSLASVGMLLLLAAIRRRRR